MIDHRVYQLDLSGEDCFPGILPKRRGNRQKINKESVMKWARLLVNAQMTEEFFKENIYFVRYAGLIPFVRIRNMVIGSRVAVPRRELLSSPCDVNFPTTHP